MRPRRKRLRREMIAVMSTSRRIPADRRVLLSASARSRATGFAKPGLLLGLAVFGVMPNAFSQSCDGQPTQAQMVQANFQRVAKEGDLASALDYAERAQRGLDQLAAHARRCECAAAQADFEAASREMRRAKLAQSRTAVRDVAAKTTVLFDAAMAELRRCAGS